MSMETLSLFILSSSESIFAAKVSNVTPSWLSSTVTMSPQLISLGTTHPILAALDGFPTIGVRSETLPTLVTETPEPEMRQRFVVESRKVPLIVRTSAGLHRMGEEHSADHLQEIQT